MKILIVVWSALILTVMLLSSCSKEPGFPSNKDPKERAAEIRKRYCERYPEQCKQNNNEKNNY